MLQLTEKREDILSTLRSDLSYLRERYGVKKVALFGSFAKGHPRKGSDIDILVELKKPLGLEFVGLADHLEHILGRKVDLVTLQTVRRSQRTARYRHIAQDIKRTLMYA